MFRERRNGNLALVAVVAAVWLSGCAGGLPRIDPSGERFLIWPNEYGSPAPYPVAPNPGAPYVMPPATTVSPPLGNIDVPPVYSDPSPGYVSGGPATANPFAPPTLIGPPVAAPASAAPVMTAPPGASVVGGTTPLQVASLTGLETAIIGPQRVLAPVGSEVVVRAGHCAATGYLLTNQRVEWMLTGDAAAQIIDLNDQGKLDMFRWPWNTPRRVNNVYAIGATSPFNDCLQRGTPDPGDDIQIRRGEAWISVASPVAGTSYLTAYFPSIYDWQRRQATSTIYWIDAQWIFPPSATVLPGTNHVLTTTVSRQTDGAPLAGWLVRYEVREGTASLGYEGSNVVEVATDAAGQASVEVSPTGGNTGSATVDVVLIRPPTAGAAPAPQLEIARGVTTVTWAAGGVAQPTGESIAEPPPTFATEPSPSDIYTPPREERPPSRAELDVQLRLEGPSNVDVGDVVTFHVTVTNRGDAPARDIIVYDQFDAGLNHPSAKLNEFEVKYDRMRDLPPGESKTVTLDFKVLEAGNLCHEVRVTARDSNEVFERGCVTARAPEPVAQPALDVRMLGPVQGQVGEFALFKIVISNTGTVPVTNLEIINEANAALAPREAEAGREVLPDGRLMWRVNRLEVGERREFKVNCEYLRPSEAACNRVLVKADGGVSYAAETCPEVNPPRQPIQPDRETPPAEQQSSDLRLRILLDANPTSVGEPMTAFFSVENEGQVARKNIEVSVWLPAELAPDTTLIRSPVDHTIRPLSGGQEVRFNPVAEVRGAEVLRFAIPVRANRQGRVQIWAQLTADGLAEPITQQSDEIEIVP